ncbi:MAG: hypothetical protein ICV70_00430 [Jiangellaceae bacterium]|nr:hypothetical protein [Jiangellaceae bacterium]
MSTLAVWLFVLVAALLVAALVVLALIVRSVYRRGRALVVELSSLAADVERTVRAEGNPFAGTEHPRR